MNVYSLVLRPVPGKTAQVREGVLTIAGAEIHLEHEGRLIVTVEETADLKASDALKLVQQLADVMSATLAYEYSDEAKDLVAGISAA
ncbi:MULTISPECIES: chaperone NapD [Chitinibacter]|uniref:chaperone NapD n=1 Tax=Chitinibacter TaxID=230666 RepID=UPI000689CC13|nr:MULTISPECIES: chaperone NapD [Chitinibacter]